MNVTAQKFQSLCELVCKSLAWRNHRTTLPQSRPLGVPAPSEREPGTMGLCHSTGCSLRRNVAGDFHRPYGGCVLLFIGGVLEEFDGEFVGEAGDDA